MLVPKGHGQIAARFSVWTEETENDTKPLSGLGGIGCSRVPRVENPWLFAPAPFGACLL